MANTSRATLLHLLVAGYDELKRRLARRLGSVELAGEALHDTFLRLEGAAEIGEVRSPRAYLFRTALNMAANRRVADSRRLTVSETDALLELADEAPDPARVVEARSDLAALQRALMELPARRRAIVFAACMDEVPHSEIAARFGVTVRTVQIELKQALTYCAQRLGRGMVRRVARRSRELCQSYPVMPSWRADAAAEDRGCGSA
jgi:RNA polymerase sigma-70 factor (ECF subfamily)